MGAVDTRFRLEITKEVLVNWVVWGIQTGSAELQAEIRSKLMAPKTSDADLRQRVGEPLRILRLFQFAESTPVLEEFKEQIISLYVDQKFAKKEKLRLAHENRLRILQNNRDTTITGLEAWCARELEFIEREEEREDEEEEDERSARCGAPRGALTRMARAVSLRRLPTDGESSDLGRPRGNELWKRAIHHASRGRLFSAPPQAATRSLAALPIDHVLEDDDDRGPAPMAPLTRGNHFVRSTSVLGSGEGSVISGSLDLRRAVEEQFAERSLDCEMELAAGIDAENERYSSELRSANLWDIDDKEVFRRSLLQRESYKRTIDFAREVASSLPAEFWDRLWDVFLHNAELLHKYLLQIDSGIWNDILRSFSEEGTDLTQFFDQRMQQAAFAGKEFADFSGEKIDLVLGDSDDDYSRISEDGFILGLLSRMIRFPQDTDISLDISLVWWRRFLNYYDWNSVCGIFNLLKDSLDGRRQRSSIVHNRVKNICLRNFGGYGFNWTKVGNLFARFTPLDTLEFNSCDFSSIPVDLWSDLRVSQDSRRGSLGFANPVQKLVFKNIDFAALPAEKIRSLPGFSADTLVLDHINIAGLLADYIERRGDCGQTKWAEFCEFLGRCKAKNLVIKNDDLSQFCADDSGHDIYWRSGVLHLNKSFFSVNLQQLNFGALSEVRYASFLDAFKEHPNVNILRVEDDTLPAEREGMNVLSHTIERQYEAQELGIKVTSTRSETKMCHFAAYNPQQQAIREAARPKPTAWQKWRESVGDWAYDNPLKAIALGVFTATALAVAGVLIASGLGAPIGAGLLTATGAALGMVTAHGLKIGFACLIGATVFGYAGKWIKDRYQESVDEYTVREQRTVKLASSVPEPRSGDEKEESGAYRYFWSSWFPAHQARQKRRVGAVVTANPHESSELSEAAPVAVSAGPSASSAR